MIAQPVHNVMFSKTGILSPTGSSKSFDAAADGYARYKYIFVCDLLSCKSHLNIKG